MNYKVLCKDRVSKAFLREMQKREDAETASRSSSFAPDRTKRTRIEGPEFPSELRD